MATREKTSIALDPDLKIRAFKRALDFGETTIGGMIDLALRRLADSSETPAPPAVVLPGAKVDPFAGLSPADREAVETFIEMLQADKSSASAHVLLFKNWRKLHPMVKSPGRQKAG